MKGGYWYSDAGPNVADIESRHFTHLFCAFADLDSNTNQVIIAPGNVSRFSTFTQTVQQKNPAVKTLLSIGGGGPSIAEPFSRMASQARTRKSFIDSSIQIARQYNFHGLDLDWEYPSSAIDYTNFGILIKEWREAVTQESIHSGRPALLLTAAVAGYDQIVALQNYPVAQISQNLDWINAMIYDLFTPGGYPNKTQPPAPLRNPVEHYSGVEGVTRWIQLGLPRNKLAFGLPFYGYSWRLVNAGDHGLFAGANGAAAAHDGGAIGYGDIINNYIHGQNAQTVYNPTFGTDYCYSGTTWIGYDDTQSITAKVNYAKENGLIGYFAWQIAHDFNWTLSQTASNAWHA